MDSKSAPRGESSQRKGSYTEKQNGSKKSRHKKKKSKKRLDRFDGDKSSTSPETCESANKNQDLNSKGTNGNATVSPSSRRDGINSFGRDPVILESDPHPPQETAENGSHDLPHLVPTKQKPEDPRVGNARSDVANDAGRTFSEGDNSVMSHRNAGGTITQDLSGGYRTKVSDRAPLAFAGFRTQGRIGCSLGGGAGPRLGGGSRDMRSTTSAVRPDTLRWELRLDDPQAEEERLRMYKLNRRKRYLAAANKSYGEWMSVHQSQPRKSPQQESPAAAVVTQPTVA